MGKALHNPRLEKLLAERYGSPMLAVKIGTAGPYRVYICGENEEAFNRNGSALFVLYGKGRYEALGYSLDDPKGRLAGFVPEPWW